MTTDTDGDGYFDSEEESYGSDPRDPNSKPDYLQLPFETDPEPTLPDPQPTDPWGGLPVDTDHDGIPDAEETASGTDPNDPNSPGWPDSTTSTTPYDSTIPEQRTLGDPQGDDDGDTLTNDDEMSIFFTDPNNIDSDGDGLIDGVEVMAYGTNPMHPDTDYDGYPDLSEIQAGTDPRDAWSSPNPSTDSTYPSDTSYQNPDTTYPTYNSYQTDTTDMPSVSSTSTTPPVD